MSGSELMWYDFLLVTEVKSREFETNALLAYELERRGYKVRILQTWEEAFCRHAPIHARVVVSWSMYNDNTFKNIASYVTGCNKMINMQREQLLTNAGAENLSDNAYLGVHGKAKNVAHLVWGNHSLRRLIDYYKVPEHNVVLTGDITLDMCRGKLAHLGINKKEICKKYNIEYNKRISMFISSFSLNDIPEKVFDDLNFDDNYVKLRRTSILSRNEIIKWIEKILPSYDGTFIYRPHPTEINNSKLLEIERKYSNFKIIGEESLRTWIFIADKIYSWWSTSIKEIYVAGKTCEILRPYKIHHDMELQILNTAVFVSDYDTFKKNMYLDTPFPIKKEIMDDFIYVDSEEATFIKIADFFEKVIKSDQFIIDFDEDSKFIREIRRIKYIMIEKIIRLLHKAFRNNKKICRGRLKKIIDSYDYALKMKNKNYFSEQEYLDIKTKIKTIIEN